MRRPPTGPFVQDDVARSERKRDELDSLRRTQVAQVEAELSELDSFTPPPASLPAELRDHWQHQNDRLLAQQQTLVHSDSAVVARELIAVREEMAALRAHAHRSDWKVGILWKVLIAVGMAALGGLGAAFSAARNAGELEGDTRAQISSGRRDLDRHEQEIQYLLHALSAPRP